ncbi:MAG: chaperone modulator CbpM [Pseudomonadales bacterium]
MSEYILLRLTEVCSELNLPREACIELVEHGVVQPEGTIPEDWTFDVTMISVIRRATRLRRDLDLDWSAVAMVVNLLEERDQLRAELEAMEQRLNRFLSD